MAEAELPEIEGESLRTVLVALAVNLGIAAAKLVAALLTRSSAMLAESFHAAADSGNQLLLLLAQRHSSVPPDERHPLGHGRVAYFWSLIASLAVFVTGALLSLGQGVQELRHPSAWPIWSCSSPSVWSWCRCDARTGRSKQKPARSAAISSSTWT